MLLHDALLYESDAGFVDAVVPFLRDGIAYGEPTYVVAPRRSCDLVREAMGRHATPVRFIDAADWYRRPATTIAAYAATLVAARQVDANIRVVGEVDFGPTALAQAEWARYESVLNAAFADEPAWILCPYDRRRLPDGVVDAAVRTHPHTVGRTRRRAPNPWFEDPGSFVAPLPLPVEGDLVVDLQLDGSLRPLRDLVRDAALRAGLPDPRVDDVVLAVDELAANALEHGSPPARVRGWSNGDCLVFEVSDRGPGLTDPLVGFVPPTPGAIGGAGFWLARQLADRVEVVPTAEGTTVRARIDLHPEP